jgi:hypothetical protein
MKLNPREGRMHARAEIHKNHAVQTLLLRVSTVYRREEFAHVAIMSLPLLANHGVHQNRIAGTFNFTPQFGSTPSSRD